MSDSVAFDRAVDYYDETRALPAPAMARVTELLTGELAGRGRVLEVGVGTGRIALPLVLAGVDVVGVDLSLPMMRRLRDKSTGVEAAVPAARADARQLPIVAGALGGAVVCHVLHLIPDWRAAVAELARVVRRGGVVLVELGGQRDEFYEMADFFQASAGVTRRHPGVENEADVANVIDEFVSNGAVLRELPAVPAERSLPPSALLSMWEQNRFSWTWPLEEGVRRRAVEATRAWAIERYGDVETPVDVRVEITWRAFDLA